MIEVPLIPQRPMFSVKCHAHTANVANDSAGDHDYLLDSTYEFNRTGIQALEPRI